MRRAALAPIALVGPSAVLGVAFVGALAARLTIRVPLGIAA